MNKKKIISIILVIICVCLALPASAEHGFGGRHRGRRRDYRCWQYYYYYLCNPQPECPEATPTPECPEATAEVTPEPTVEITPEPTAEVTPEPTAIATPEPTVEATPEPTIEVTPEPTVAVTPEPTVEATPDSGTSSSSAADEVIRQVNAERAAQGLSKLRVDAELTRAAYIRAAELVDNFSHTRPDGSEWSTVSGLARGENIAMGYNSPDKVMAAWMTSSGHRANILREGFTTIGVCAYEYNGVLYWVQLFGTN